jgi:tetratricopeptide (TPR) repeat protein
MKSLKIIGLSVVLLLAAACGGSKGKGPETGKTTKGPDGSSGGAQVVGEAKTKFTTGMDKMVAHDKKSDWNDASCTEVAQDFSQAAELQRKNAAKEEDRKFPEAIYNAGLAYQRCAKDAEAKAKFQAALAEDPAMHRAKVQVVLYEYKEKGDSVLDGTMKQLQDAVLEAKFQNVDALVNLAMLEIKRGGSQEWQGCKDDYDCAKLNIRRALAIDDGYMPAFNQLAIYYLNLARAKAQPDAGKGKKGGGMLSARGKSAQLSGQMLDLAALVCSQAIRKNQSYAPIHNTAGLIQVELKNINSAVQSFNTARQLDPNFFEAQMNYAAVNLSFRGFDQADGAYRQALKMRPNSYEAHLGLALALRGEITDSNWDKNLLDAQKELDACKKLAPERPETYYNEAILTQEYKAKVSTGDNAKAIEMLKQAKTIYDQFIQKAAGGAEYAEAIKRSNERKEDLEKMIKFLTEGEKERRKMEAEEAEKAAQAAAPAAPSGIDENAGKEGDKKEGDQPKPEAPKDEKK